MFGSILKFQGKKGQETAQIATLSVPKTLTGRVLHLSWLFWQDKHLVLFDVHTGNASEQQCQVASVD